MCIVSLFSWHSFFSIYVIIIVAIGCGLIKILFSFHEHVNGFSFSHYKRGSFHKPIYIYIYVCVCVCVLILLAIFVDKESSVSVMEQVLIKIK